MNLHGDAKLRPASRRALVVAAVKVAFGGIY